MQLRQEYTVNNTTYKNEMFISEKDNIDIYKLIFHFFNCPMPAQKIKNICIIPANIKEAEDAETKDEQPAKTEEKSATDENNNTVVTVPVEHEEKETDVNVNVAKKETDEADTPGYYIKVRIGYDISERWSRSQTEANARATIYNYVSKLQKEYKTDVEYEFLELKPMTKKEFENRNK